MTQVSFVNRRAKSWNEFESLCAGSKKALCKNAGSFPARYRTITQDLNIARANAFDPLLIDRLNRLVLDAHQILYAQHHESPAVFLGLALRSFPRALRAQGLGVCLTALLFYGVTFLVGFLTVQNPALVYDFMGTLETAQIEEMYNPDNAHYLQPRNVDGDADMFGFYIYNNISIAFRTFACGIFAGIGSLFILCTNALSIGLVAGHLFNKGFAVTFFPFVIAHSAFELNAIVFSAYCGLYMGWRFFVTRGLSRTASIKAAGLVTVPIMAGSGLLLVLAAAIEAFWSSQVRLPINVRLGVGMVCWAVFLAYILFCGRSKRHE
ncbi:stage II sporulation protein M [Breznakiellaceae bacterium SP9]